MKKTLAMKEVNAANSCNYMFMSSHTTFPETLTALLNRTYVLFVPALVEKLLVPKV